MSAPTCANCGQPAFGNVVCEACAVRSAANVSDMVASSICTLLGPTAHYDSFDAASIELGKLGWLVFSVGSHRLDDRGLGTTDEQRRTYWRTHRQKMDMSSMAFVVDLPHPDAPQSMRRVGSDTREEIEYARKIGINVVRMGDVWPSSLPPIPGGAAGAAGAASTPPPPSPPPAPSPPSTAASADGKRPPKAGKGHAGGARSPIESELERVNHEIAARLDGIQNLDVYKGAKAGGRRGGNESADAVCREIGELLTRRGELLRLRGQQPGGTGAVAGG